jgi:glycosyltransferase involved in cell wall biosynthesis
LEWRKGSELFIQLAISARRLGLTDRVRFVWVGADRTRVEVLEHLVDIERAGLTGIVHLVDIQADPRPYHRLFDAFALTSRSDPFPLVSLEAAAAETPIVCFQDSGGMPEFVADGCGFVVPYGDVEEMMLRIAELIEDPALCRRLGQRAAQKVRTENDVGVVAPKVLAIIESCMADRSRPNSLD